MTAARTRTPHAPYGPEQEPLTPGTRTAAVPDRSQRFAPGATGVGCRAADEREEERP